MAGKRKGKRSRGAKGKTPVFAMIERNSKVVVEVVPDVSSNTPRQIIKERVSKMLRFTPISLEVIIVCLLTVITI